MSPQPFVVASKNHPAPLNVVGEHITVLASGVGSEMKSAPTGTLVHLPAGSTHWFRFGKGGGQMVSMTSRLGASRMFADMDREMSPDRPDLDKLTGMGARHGLTVAA